MPPFSGRDEFETGLLKACVGLPTEANMNDPKNTWAGINQLTYGKKKKSKPISSLRRFNNCKRFIIPFSDLISIKAWDEIALSFA